MASTTLFMLQAFEESRNGTERHVLASASTLEYDAVEALHTVERSHVVAFFELGELSRQCFNTLVHESVEALQLFPIESGTIVKSYRLPPDTGDSARHNTRTWTTKNDTQSISYRMKETTRFSGRHRRKSTR